MNSHTFNTLLPIIRLVIIQAEAEFTRNVRRMSVYHYLPEEESLLIHTMGDYYYRKN